VGVGAQRAADLLAHLHTEHGVTLAPSAPRETTTCPDCGDAVDAPILNWHRARQHGATHLPI
jgi:predicted RNA-binding Zn-ribbon protein involved in translation (DUF1610 family)